MYYSHEGAVSMSDINNEESIGRVEKIEMGNLFIFERNNGEEGETVNMTNNCPGDRRETCRIQETKKSEF